MSNVIKLNPGNIKPNVKVSAYGAAAGTDDEVDLFKKQLDEYFLKGYKEAEEKTRREVEQEYTNKLVRKYEEVYNIMREFDERFVEFEKSFEVLVIETAFELAKKVVQREISSETIINENVRNAINRIIGANEVRLKLNPADIEEISQTSKKIIYGSSFNKIKIEADERIEPGGCLVETEIGSVDARISTQLNELKKVLEDSLTKKN
ncbi:MAG: FliH/SctL family protein [Bacteroidota bacterium]